MHGQQHHGSLFFFLNGKKEGQTLMHLPIIGNSETELCNIHHSSAHALPNCIMDEILNDIDHHPLSPNTCSKIDIKCQNYTKETYSTNLYPCTNTNNIQTHRNTICDIPTTSSNATNIDKQIEISIAIQKEIDYMFSEITVDELGINVLDNAVNKDELLCKEDGWWVSDDYYNNNIEFDYHKSFVYYGVDI
eukprot:986505_1